MSQSRTNFIAPILLSLLLVVGCTGKNGSDKASEYVERSSAYVEQGQYRAALIEIRNAIQSDPENISYISQYGDILVTIGSLTQAEELLKARAGESDHMRLKLAEAQLKQGKFISAKSVLDGWNSSPAEKAEYQRLNAIQKFLAGDQSVALTELRELSEQSQASIKTTLELIRLLIQSGKYEEAQHWCSNLLEKYPTNPDVLYFDALIAYHDNSLDAAEKSLTDALIYLPETDILLQSKLRVLELLSTVLTDQGRSSDARVYSRIIREANPDAFLARQQYKDALNAASQGDLTSAKSAFEDILNQFPNNQQAALLLGLINLEEGNIVKGESLLSQNLDTETAPLSLIQATALAQADQNKPDLALQVLDKALLARPDDISLLSLYGVISLNSNRELDGIQAISKALELDPSRTRLHLLLAQYYVEKGKDRIALGHLRKAYRQKKSDWPTTGYYLSTLIEQHENNEAQKIRNDILETYGSDESAQWIVAMADYRLGNTQAAIDELALLHKQAPSALNVIVTLARLYQLEGRYDNSSSMWLKAIELNPTNSYFVASLVQTKSKTLSTNKLINWLEKEVQRNREIALPLNSVLVELLVNQKNMTQAKAIAAEYDTNDQPMAQTIRANILRGEAFFNAQQGNWQAALGQVESALELVPANTSLIVLAVQIEKQLGQLDSAKSRLEDQLDSNPNNTRLQIERADIYLRQEGKEKSYAYLKKLWQKQPSSALSRVYIPLVAELESGNIESVYRQLVEAEPGNSNAVMALGNIHLKQGQLENAISNYQRAIELNPDNVPALNNLAWLLRKQNPNKALVHAKRAVTLMPESASVLDTYGWLLHLNGKQENAISVLEKALSLDSENSEIHQHLIQARN